MLIQLGLSPQTARANACRIEHDLSTESFDAIRKHFSQYKQLSAMNKECLP